MSLKHTIEALTSLYKLSSIPQSTSAGKFLSSGLNTSHVLNGRVKSIRDSSKFLFADLDTGDQAPVQFMIDKTNSEINTKALKRGDIVSIQGEKRTTKSNQETLCISSLQTLSTCGPGLPGGYYGLKDNELRFQRRCLDFMVNTHNRDYLRLRSSLYKRIRDCLEQEGFLEVETPVLCRSKQGAIAKPFVTRHNSLDAELYLRIAPELYLKMLIISGFPRVYELGRNFRNEDTSPRHNPEFTALELYASYWDYRDMLAFTVSLLGRLLDGVVNFDDLVFIDLVQVFKSKGVFSCQEDELISKVKDYVLSLYRQEYEAFCVDSTMKEDKRLIEFFIDKEVEGKLLDKPTIVLNHPAVISPLAKRLPNERLFTQRFELFINKTELCNAYTEENDPLDQAERLSSESQLDQEYLEAMTYGMPPTAGLGIGIDRLLMLISGSKSIKEVLAFPLVNKRH